MRSHQISVPRVQDTVATNRPNACNSCHLDRTLAWTAAALRRWFGTPVPSLSEEQRTLAAAALDAARGEPGVRALAAWSMGWDAARAASNGDWMAPILIELLDDEYAAVRYIAYHSLRQISGFGDFEYDYVAAREARWSAQEAARARWRRRAPGQARPELLIGADGRFARGELERLMAERPEDDEMFLAE